MVKRYPSFSSERFATFSRRSLISRWCVRCADVSAPMLQTRTRVLLEPEAPATAAKSVKDESAISFLKDTLVLLSQQRTTSSTLEVKRHHMEISIGELARRAGLAASTIRYYEEVGLLPPPARAGGRRGFDEQAVDRLLGLNVPKGISI